MRVSFQMSEVTLARMVMPRSRSSALESMARSATFWPARKEPEAREEHVDQGRLAMIDMRDDGDVAKGRRHKSLPGFGNCAAAIADFQPIR